MTLKVNEDAGWKDFWRNEWLPFSSIYGGLKKKQSVLIYRKSYF